MEAAVANIRRLMEDNQYYRSTITHFEQNNPADQQIEITFRIHSGDPARAGNITLEGHSLNTLGQIEDMARLHSGDIVSAQNLPTLLTAFANATRTMDAGWCRPALRDTRMFQPATRWTTRCSSSP